ncbi:VOC family protein [Cesiribacter andamanensis]|uniref:Glyoxalase/fosfomycin resistance/dioxygenase domain-containing protein n=1 Tax=Cesiribacter andamanensis AMV16 TaxID=1279009 RepID=M7NC21_9BACT|nr:VOC family protein [Cesiribacter andamanensis]EMR04767.1 hypothetical protein ADICEAN_00038 [Cesiribacter andamanensis AMV16]
MVTVQPYLNFKGTTEAAFTFYKSVFGGEFIAMQRFKDTPEGARLPAHEQDKIMHAALAIGKNTVLMATDALESAGHQVQEGTNFHLSLQVESEQEADALFAALAEGGKVNMPLQSTFWGDYFGMLQDRFGIQWMISYTYPVAVGQTASDQQAGTVV